MTATTIELRDAVSAAYQSVHADATHGLVVVARLGVIDALRGIPDALDRDFAVEQYALDLEAQALRAEWYALSAEARRR